MNYKNILFTVCLIFILPQIPFAQTANPQQYKYIFTVAKDGSGDFKYIQDAIDAMRVYPLASITLYIKNGIYNEKIDLPETNTDVTFIGESVDKTIINFDDYSGRGKLTTFTSYTAKISGNRFYAENITFKIRLALSGRRSPCTLTQIKWFLKIAGLSETRIPFLLPEKIPVNISIVVI